MRYAVFSGGKRLRPTLAFGAAVAAGVDPEHAMPVANAVELVHAASLVFDDLPAQDDNTVRRGQPAVHIAFGHATAMLAGTALLTRAFAKCNELSDPSACVAVGARLSRLIGSGGLIGGQFDDLAFTPSGKGVEDVAGIHLRKTAALFRFSVWGGGVAGGLAGESLDRLDAFGRAYGLAFQALDDLRDEDIGGSSILHVLSRRQARGRIRQLVARAKREVEPFGPNGWVLSGLTGRLRELMR